MKNMNATSVTGTNSFVEAMKVESNYTLTENLAKTNRSTLSHVLDWFGAGGALRTRPEADIVRLFSNAWAEDRLLALKILFYFRDVREGQGERKTFRVLLNWLANRYGDVVEKNIENVPFYGRWDDLYALLKTPLEAEAFKFIAAQLRKDVQDMNAGESVSLLAKWLKSENTSSRESRALGRATREALGFTPKKYRKTLSKLRAHIDVIERKLCAGNWDAIDYEKVPSKASLVYRKAFGRHDHDRYDAYLKAVEKGEAKMNAGAVYPYEIVRAILHTSEAQMIKGLDLQWKAMPNWLDGNEHKGIVLADMSGSMYGSNNGLPAYVALSLAIYFAERNVGPFKDVFISFSAQPKFHTIHGNNLREKIDGMDKRDWAQNTDLQAAFDLILRTAVSNSVPKQDMPEVLYVVSDMEHDAACPGNQKTNFEVIREKYEQAGYKLPRLVWWNVDSRNDNFPIRVDDSGTAMVSGCSPSILKSLLSAKSFDPLDIVYETVNAERYNRVTV
jgi:hypothetical protein